MIEPTIVGWLVEKTWEAGVTAAIRDLLSHRLESRAKILKDELERGERFPAEIEGRDQVAAMIFEYIELTKRGTARRNMRLLAQIMSGMASMPQIYASDFLKWSSLLANLSREEIIAAATLHSALQQPNAQSNMGATMKGIEWQLIDQQRVFSSKADLQATLHALVRTGLVIPQSAYGALIFITTPRMDELLRLTRLEEALAEPDD